MCSLERLVLTNAVLVIKDHPGTDIASVHCECVEKGVIVSQNLLLSDNIHH